MNPDNLPRRSGFHNLGNPQVHGLTPNSAGEEYDGSIQADNAKALAGIGLYDAGVDLIFTKRFHGGCLQGPSRWDGRWCHDDGGAIHPPFSFRQDEKKMGCGRSKRKGVGRKLARAYKFA